MENNKPMTQEEFDKLPIEKKYELVSQQNDRLREMNQKLYSDNLRMSESINIEASKIIMDIAKSDIFSTEERMKAHDIIVEYYLNNTREDSDE